jgi:hypothetical protein
LDNPFERYDLDPHAGIEAITARLKELAEDAKDDAAREEIRAAWEELTLHPARRLRAALLAHPETRAPLGAPPFEPRARASGAGLGLRDLLERPRVSPVTDPAQPAGVAPSLADDPLL